jgi:hypothetical protein
MSDQPVASTSDGYTVVLAAQNLLTAAEGIKKHQTAVEATREHLISSIVPVDAFGTIPGGADAAKRLRSVVNDHIDAITTMGVTVADLAARVTAAGQLAEQAEPATAKAARIPEPFEEG